MDAASVMRAVGDASALRQRCTATCDGAPGASHSLPWWFEAEERREGEGEGEGEGRSGEERRGEEKRREEERSVYVREDGREAV